MSAELHGGRGKTYQLIRFALSSPCSRPGSVAQSPPPADLVVTNAIIYTADSAHPRAEALAVRGDRIVFVGSNAEAAAFAAPATVRIDAGGRPLYPGFIDAHAHLRNLSLILATLDLRGVPSYDSLVTLVLCEGGAGGAAAPGFADAAGTRTSGAPTFPRTSCSHVPRRQPGLPAPGRRPRRTGEPGRAAPGGHHAEHARSAGRPHRARRATANPPAC